MTDKTATQNLTRTTAQDDPRQMAAYLAQLAGEIDLRLAAHAYDLSRSRTRPFAVLRRAAAGQYDASTSTPMPFDLVGEDTAGLVDLSVSDQVINLRTTGYWAVGGYVQCTGFGAAASDTVVTVTGATWSARGTARDAAIGLASASASLTVKVTTPNVSTASLVLGWVGASTSSVTTLQFAELWAYKVRDL